MIKELLFILWQVNWDHIVIFSVIEELPIYNPIVYIRPSDDKTFMDSYANDRETNLDTTVCGFKPGNVTDARMRFICTQTLVGRYVFIDSYDGGNEHQLHFLEFEVYGYFEQEASDWG